MAKNNELLERKDIPKEYKWDIESIFRDFDQWGKSFKEAQVLADEFTKYQGKVIDTSENLYNALRDHD